MLRRITVSMTLLTTVCLATGSGWCAHVRADAAAPTDAATALLPSVFGKGAEFHLLAAWSPRTGEHYFNLAHAGTRVTAVGLGFHPGAQLKIIYAMAGTNFLL